jgi:tRNA (cmo5U34)-methyltransferase
LAGCQKRGIFLEEQKRAPEEMASFFNLRAGTYEEHMKNTIASFADYYASISEPVEETQEEIKILDLGCGTGLELEGILRKTPNSRITGIDMSEEMLELLLSKYDSHKGRITVVTGSYLDVPFGENQYDYVVSVMTIHHLLHDEKRALYEKIWRSLKKGGKYIEGDYVVSSAEEEEAVAQYKEEVQRNFLSSANLYHIDVPFCVETEERLFKEAGFNQFKLTWEEENAAIYYGVK